MVDAVRESGRPGRPIATEHDADGAAAYARLESVEQETPPMTQTELAVPELSGTGKSQSNGRAERGVQRVEDQARTLPAALQHRMGCDIACTHPLMAKIILRFLHDILNGWRQKKLKDSCAIPVV